MSDFKIVIGEATTNYVLNPSGETTGNYAAESGATVTRSTTYQKYGLYSYRVETNANNEGIQFTLSALSNAIHYVTLLVRGTLPTAWDWALNGSTFTSPTLIEQIDSNWALYGLQFPAAQANGSTLLEIHQNGAGSGDFYIDAVQVEQKEYWTTYCDGTQEDCGWNGVENASTSSRSAASRAGGRVRDLQDDYYFYIGGITGGGAPSQQLGLDNYAILPGGELNSVKIESRVLTITGVISGSTDADFHQKQANLLAALKGDSYPNNQPVKIRYNGATIHKEISLYYDNGLEGELQATMPCWEKVAIRFIAPDPFWYEIGESAALLDTNDSATFRTVAGRLKSTGQWSALGPPNAAGTYTAVHAIAEDLTYIYFGGDFLNFDNIANADYIVRYNKQTGAYSALGVGLNGIVRAITISPNGDVYIGGEFTNAGGVAAADYLTRWDGANYNAVGTPSGAPLLFIRTIAIDHSGNIYIGGAFTNFAGIAAADNIVMWDGSAYAAVGSGLNNIVYSIIVGLDNTIYIGGSFTNEGPYVATWDGSAYTDLAGLGNDVYSLTFGADQKILYAGGIFAVAPYIYIAFHNGTAWSALSNNPNSNVEVVAIGSDGMLHVGGVFTSIGGLTVADRMARYNGYAWTHFDIDLPGSPVVTAMLPSKYPDPVIKQKYDLFVGFNTTGTGYFAGKTTITNEGTVIAFPKIIYHRSGGTSAIIETLKNETTGKEILFNYSLLNGERLTMDLSPGNRSIVSSFFGPRPDAILANSDDGSWVLNPGSNDITSFVATAGSPTVTAWMTWREGHATY